jgi:hypothetical protein
MSRTIKSWSGRRYGSSDKLGKIQSHRLFRRLEKRFLAYEGRLPKHMRDALDPWSMPRDGFRYFDPLMKLKRSVRINRANKRPLQFRNEDDMLRYFGINPNSVTDV